jgi:hypothetical protein
MISFNTKVFYIMIDSTWVKNVLVTINNNIGIYFMSLTFEILV